MLPKLPDDGVRTALLELDEVTDWQLDRAEDSEAYQPSVVGRLQVGDGVTSTVAIYT